MNTIQAINMGLILFESYFALSVNNDRTPATIKAHDYTMVGALCFSFLSHVLILIYLTMLDGLNYIVDLKNRFIKYIKERLAYFKN